MASADDACELHVHVSAYRNSEEDQKYRLQLRHFLDFEAVRFDGEDILPQSQIRTGRSVGTDQRRSEQDGSNTNDCEQVEAAASARNMQTSVGQLHHECAALVAASPLVLVRTTPAGFTGFRPVAETPIQSREVSYQPELVINSAQPAYNFASRNSSPSAVPDSFVGALKHTPAENSLRRKLGPAPKRLKMSDSDSSTEYPLPPVRTTSSAQRSLPAANVSQGVYNCLPSTQDAYVSAARDFADEMQTPKSDFVKSHAASHRTSPGFNSSSLLLLRQEQDQIPIIDLETSEQGAETVPNTPPRQAGERALVSNSDLALVQSERLQQELLVLQRTLNMRHVVAEPHDEPEETTPAAADPAQQSGEVSSALDALDHQSVSSPTSSRSSPPESGWPPGKNWFIGQPAATNYHGQFKTHLRCLHTELSAATLTGDRSISSFYPGKQMCDEEIDQDCRGAWTFRIPMPDDSYGWSLYERNEFWKCLAGWVTNGSLGVVNIEQLSATLMKPENSGFGQDDDVYTRVASDADWVRVYCWGAVLKETWCALFLASRGRILQLPGGMRWVVLRQALVIVSGV